MAAITAVDIAAAKTSRINTGIYQAKFRSGHTYEVERFPDGSWLLFLTTSGDREYCSDFWTKRDAFAHAARVEAALLPAAGGVKPPKL
jgi:hypothetical protein